MEKQEHSEYVQFRKFMNSVNCGNIDLLFRAMKKAKATTATIPKDPVLWGWRTGFVAKTKL